VNCTDKISMLDDASISHLISWSPTEDSFLMSPSNDFSKVLSYDSLLQNGVTKLTIVGNISNILISLLSFAN